MLLGHQDYDVDHHGNLFLLLCCMCCASIPTNKSQHVPQQNLSPSFESICCASFSPCYSWMLWIPHLRYRAQFATNPPPPPHKTSSQTKSIVYSPEYTLRDQLRQVLQSVKEYSDSSLSHAPVSRSFSLSRPLLGHFWPGHYDVMWRYGTVSLLSQLVCDEKASSFSRKCATRATKCNEITYKVWLGRIPSKSLIPLSRSSL